MILDVVVAHEAETPAKGRRAVRSLSVLSRISLHVPSVASDEAPVALRVPPVEGAAPVPVRLRGDRLYGPWSNGGSGRADAASVVACLVDTDVTGAVGAMLRTDLDPAEADETGLEALTIAAILQKRVDEGLLLVDGVLHCVVGTPLVIDPRPSYGEPALDRVVPAAAWQAERPKVFGWFSGAPLGGTTVSEAMGVVPEPGGPWERCLERAALFVDPSAYVLSAVDDADGFDGEGDEEGEEPTDHPADVPFLFLGAGIAAAASCAPDASADDVCDAIDAAIEPSPSGLGEAGAVYAPWDGEGRTSLVAFPWRDADDREGRLAWNVGRGVVGLPALNSAIPYRHRGSVDMVAMSKEWIVLEGDGEFFVDSGIGMERMDPDQAKARRVAQGDIDAQRHRAIAADLLIQTAAPLANLPKDLPDVYGESVMRRPGQAEDIEGDREERARAFARHRLAAFGGEYRDTLLFRVPEPVLSVSVGSRGVRSSTDLSFALRERPSISPAYRFRLDDAEGPAELADALGARNVSRADFEIRRADAFRFDSDAWNLRTAVASLLPGAAVRCTFLSGEGLSACLRLARRTKVWSLSSSVADASGDMPAFARDAHLLLDELAEPIFAGLLDVRIAPLARTWSGRVLRRTDSVPVVEDDPEDLWLGGLAM